MDLHAVSCFLILLTCTGVSFGQELTLPEGKDTEAGMDVVITPLKIPDPTPVLFRWMFNGSIFINVYPGGNVTSSGYIGRVSVNTGNLALELRNLTERDTGQYTLTAESDSVVFTDQTSLQVWEKIIVAEITGPTDVLIEGVSSATLNCKASGTLRSAEWTKDGQKLSASDSITFSDNNRSVTISPVRRAENGVYQCTFSNPISSDSANYTMIVNFGPDNVIINGPAAVEEEKSLTLSCKAESVPNASYKWKFNGTSTEVNTAVFTVEKTNYSHTGTYTSTAFNSVTGHEASASHVLIVKEKGTAGGNGDSLSAGAIAGIVIAVLLGLAGIAGLIFYFMKAQEMPRIKSRGKNQIEATPNAQQEDSHYVNVTGVMMSSNATKKGPTAQPDQDPIYEN